VGLELFLLPGSSKVDPFIVPCSGQMHVTILVVAF
jgi:hypothetical protein